MHIKSDRQFDRVAVLSVMWRIAGSRIVSCHTNEQEEMMEFCLIGRDT